MDRLENIDFCIRYLMRQGGIEAEVPPSLEGKQRLFRALCNVWQPQPLSVDYLNAQDAELQAQMADKGVVKPEGSGITLWQGDITRLQADAIVNAANSHGLGCWHPLHSCIDNAIHSAAGLQLRQACNDILKGRMIKTGEAIITKGYNLPCKYVIHTVGPIIPTGVPTKEQEQQLADCYANSLHLAESNGCRSIAFCCISTGEFRFPNRRAAEIAVATIKAFLSSHITQLQILFNVFKDIDYDIYRKLLGKD